jgi:hypothetical protein
MDKFFKNNNGKKLDFNVKRIFYENFIVNILKFGVKIKLKIPENQ